ncbi:LLM class flavin-dependent oxidoreductase [Mycobacterium sp.]|uniref:LLM class flavin-dependent oxidoreductase n=1 Tax=Mycobacterium sp. TaxID=1785 RepID=UPI002D8DD614|nr:LLM class flavin-dependent oxidoreductase [Mycobacterium sp.]
MSPRVGVVFRPDFKPDSLREIASAAERAGIDELWLWEDCFLQGGIAAAAVALASTDTLAVGIGVLPAPLRNVVTTAMEIATLEAMFPGRIRLGIGHGVQDWMRQAGAAVASPLTLLREYVSALKGLLAGQSVSVEGRYVRLDDVKLDWAPAQEVPVLIGGTGPKTLRLAGEIASGVILDCAYTAATVLQGIGHVAAGRDIRAEPFSTVMFLVCAPGADAHARLEQAAKTWNVEPAGEFGVGGTADEIAAAVGAYLDAGVDTVVFQSTGTASEMNEFIMAIGDVADKL